MVFYIRLCLPKYEGEKRARKFEGRELGHNDMSFGVISTGVARDWPSATPNEIPMQQVQAIALICSCQELGPHAIRGNHNFVRNA